MQQHVVVLPSPTLPQRMGVTGQVRVRQHRPLRTTRGARRIKNGGQVVTRSCGDGVRRFRDVGRVGQRAVAIAVEVERDGVPADCR